MDTTCLNKNITTNGFERITREYMMLHTKLYYINALNLLLTRFAKLKMPKNIVTMHLRVVCLQVNLHTSL